MFGRSDRRARERLKERGERAWATVQEIASDGKEVTDEDGQQATLVKCRLRVEAADGFPFSFEDKLAFPQLGVPSVGSRIAVVYDPKDHDTLIVDRGGGPAPPAAPAPAPAAAAPAPPPAPTSAAPAPAAFNFASPGIMDLGRLMKQVQEARAITGNDPQALAHELQKRFMGQAFEFSAPTGGAPAPAADDTLDRLEKLADLKAKGVLTDEEFKAAKAKILDS
jgi:hypothetical protein